MKTFIILSLALCFLFFAAAPVSAQIESINLLKNAGKEAGYNQAADQYSLSATIGKVINAALGLVGTIFLVLTIYAGYRWLTAGGEEDKVEEAKKYLKNSVLGLIIVLAAWGLARFVVPALMSAAGVL